MFDSKAPINVKFPSPEGFKTVTVNFPTDSQWCHRARKQKVISRAIGRGKSVTDVVGGAEQDLELVNSISNGQADCDQYEASNVVAKISRAQVTDSTNEGSQFRVTLKTLGGETQHVLRMPSMKQMHDYQRDSISLVEGRRGVQEFTMKLEAAGALYDQLQVSQEGYASDVPVIHKQAVVSEVMFLVNAEEEEGDPNS